MSDPIITRIQALLAKAESTGGTLVTAPSLRDRIAQAIECSDDVLITEETP